MILNTESSISKFQETMIYCYCSRNSSQNKSKNKGLSFSYVEFRALVLKPLLVGCMHGNSGEELGVLKPLREHRALLFLGVCKKPNCAPPPLRMWLYLDIGSLTR